MKFKWRGREYGDKDIIIWVLIALVLFTISYAHSLENLAEDLDYDLQKCSYQKNPVANFPIGKIPNLEDYKIPNVSEVDDGQEK